MRECTHKGCARDCVEGAQHAYPTHPLYTSTHQEGMHLKPGRNAFETRNVHLGRKPGRNAFKTWKRCTGNQEGTHKTQAILVCQNHNRFYNMVIPSVEFL